MLWILIRHRGEDREIVAGEMQVRVGISSHPVDREFGIGVTELRRVGRILVESLIRLRPGGSNSRGVTGVLPVRKCAAVNA